MKAASIFLEFFYRGHERPPHGRKHTNWHSTNSPRTLKTALFSNSNCTHILYYFSFLGKMFLLFLFRLTSLFNLDNSERYHFDVLLALLKTSKASNSANLLVPQLGKLDSWIQRWKLNEADERALLLLLHETFLSSEKHQELSLKYAFQFLKTFNKSSPDLASSSPVAVSAVVLSVKLLSVKDFDEITSLHAVSHLKEDPAHSSLHRLLEIFSTGKVEDFLSFEKQHADTLQAHGLSICFSFLVFSFL